MPEYEAVIGLEVHAQLKTRSKIFCGCPTTFGSPPNTQTCPVCLGHPGALPVLNRGAVELAVRGALALGCDVQERSVFARKNYFYPDLPKGYQISQYDEPLAVGGAVAVEVEGRRHDIGLIRLHLEEDAGKSIHEGMPDSDRFSHVDLNRAGVPLVEIVSQPEVRSPREAYLCLQRLRSILRYTDVCDANLEEGSMRCDANVSIRPRGARELGTRTELKNLNSFRNVERALRYEIEHQSELVGSGGEVVQETVLWDASAGRTRPMRGKEEAQDYRYFPEPDLAPLMLDPAWVESIRGGLPELPAQRKDRLVTHYGLAEEEAHRLSLERIPADFFEEVASTSGNPRMAANFILNDLVREQNAMGKDETDIPIPAAHLAELIAMVEDRTVSMSAARRLFEDLFRTGRRPSELAREQGVEQLDDDHALREMVATVVADHPDQVALYRGGKTGLLGWFVGRVMRASGGRADPGRVNELVREHLEES